MIRIAGNFASDNPLGNQTMRNRRSSRMQQLIQQRMQDQLREQTIQERENQIMSEMRTRKSNKISNIREAEAYDRSQRREAIQNLSEELAYNIQQIRENREGRTIFLQVQRIDAEGNAQTQDKPQCERSAEQAREREVRELEDQMIRDMQEDTNNKINLIREEGAINSNIRHETIQGLLETLAMRIQQIEENRAKRAVAAAEREAARTQAIIEENTKAQENSDQEYETREEAEEAEKRSSIRSMVNIAIAADNLSTLKQTRSRLSVEAGMLNWALESDNSNKIKIGTAPNIEAVVNVQSGHDDSFRTRQLAKLTKGIARLDATIMSGIASMYRDSMQMQEGQLREYREEMEANEDEQEQCEALA